MIRICLRGHVTGYKFCPQCGTRAERQPFHIMMRPPVQQVKRERPTQNELARRLEQANRDAGVHA